MPWNNLANEISNFIIIGHEFIPRNIGVGAGFLFERGFGQITYNIRLAFEVGGNRFKSTLRCLDDAHGVFGAHKLGCSSLEIGICTSQRR